jgi:hypothetical protein
MRMPIYVMITIAAFALVLLNGQGIRNWLISIRTEIDLDQQQNKMIKTNQNTQRLTVLNSGLMVLLTAQPSVSRVRVAMIHTAISPQGQAVLLWDVVDSTAQKGHDPGEKFIDQPLEQWADFLGPMLAHQCVYVVNRQIKNPTVKTRMKKLNIAAFLACPILHKNSQLIGGLFASWDRIEDVPADMAPVRSALINAAAIIGETYKS